MTVIDHYDALGLEPGGAALVEAAARDGFSLVQFETATGQLVWEWRRGSEPRPQFVSRRVALVWMKEWLARAS